MKPLPEIDTKKEFGVSAPSKLNILANFVNEQRKVINDLSKRVEKLESES